MAQTARLVLSEAAYATRGASGAAIDLVRRTPTVFCTGVKAVSAHDLRSFAELSLRGHMMLGSSPRRNGAHHPLKARPPTTSPPQAWETSTPEPHAAGRPAIA